MGEAGDLRPYQPEGGLRPEIEPGLGPPGRRTRVGLVLVRFGSSPWLQTPGVREGLSLAAPVGAGTRAHIRGAMCHTEFLSHTSSRS